MGAELRPSSANWNVVDEAVHQAFSSAAVLDPSKQLNLAELVANIADIPSGPPGSERVSSLPPAPCRGLARLECLTPRPFYVTDLDQQKKTVASQAAEDRPCPDSSDPAEAEDLIEASEEVP